MLWCRDCDVCFVHPAPAEARSQWQVSDGEELTTSLGHDVTSTMKVRLDVISACGPRGRKVLDVGCGKGHFVHVARASGWDAWGVDLNADACGYATRRFGLRTILTGTVDHPALPCDFDVVTLWNVIEHAANPVQLLRDAATRLKPDGLLVIRTGNRRSWKFDRDRNRWLTFGMTRRTYFSSRSLTKALAAAGWSVDPSARQESSAQPEWALARDISQTSLAEGFVAVSRSPAKLAKTGLYLGHLLRRMIGEMRYGAGYRAPVITAVAARRERSAS